MYFCTNARVQREAADGLREKGGEASEGGGEGVALREMRQAHARAGWLQFHPKHQRTKGTKEAERARGSAPADEAFIGAT